MNAGVPEAERRSDGQVLHRAGDEDLARSRDRQHAGARVDPNPADVPVDRLDLARVHTRADLDPKRTSSTIPSAARTACAGSANVARNPSPVKLSSRPPSAFNRPRTTFPKRLRRPCHRASPISEATEVEPTMSRKSTVARRRPPRRRGMG